MAATQTVYQLPQSRNSSDAIPTIQGIEILTPQHGVVTLFGYGITVRVDRGHLILEDGIGPARRQGRLPRVGHGLRRLVVIGADGMVSLAALRWLADQDAAFIMLERNGKVLAVTGPVRPSDARLRRVQALAQQSGAAVEIAKNLIEAKLGGQETLVRDNLKDSTTAEVIAQFRGRLTAAKTIEAIRTLEAHAAAAYWGTWRDVPILFPKADLPKVPAHWRYFGTRASPLTGSPRLAVTPPGAILNYCYAVLESEARLAASALGLDPGIGMLHVDAPNRDSLAFDIMEPVRPSVDAWLLDWITREPLRREWFFEQRDGNCRLMGPFAVRLAETASTWARAIAPIAEWVARTLWASIPRPSKRLWPATRLTQGHRRVANGRPAGLPSQPAPRPPVVCRLCGTPIASGHSYCASCSVTISRENLIEAAKVGRLAGHSPEARARQAEKQRRHAAERKGWNPSNQPSWLTEKIYREKIQPRLSGITVPAISSALGISEPYAAEIRAGRRRPHPRHWRTLARLVGIAPDV